MRAQSTVLYYNRGTSCYVRLLVSIFSLRKHYGGEITVMAESGLHDEIVAVLRVLDVTVQPIPAKSCGVLVRKASLWRELKQDQALFLDSDTIVCAPIGPLVDAVTEHGLLVSWFNSWTTHSPPVAGRIRDWRRVAPKLIAPALSYGKAINSGVQGWHRLAPILAEHEDLTRRGEAAGCKRLFLDEIALQLLIPRHPHFIAAPSWNTSGRLGDVAAARIIHYHGRKHCLPNEPRCGPWLRSYAEIREAFPAHRATLDNCWGDRRLQEYKQVQQPASPTVT